jgi:hypothetical protein
MPSPGMAAIKYVFMGGLLGGTMGFNYERPKPRSVLPAASGPA